MALLPWGRKTLSIKWGHKIWIKVFYEWKSTIIFQERFFLAGETQEYEILTVFNNNFCFFFLKKTSSISLSYKQNLLEYLLHQNSFFSYFIDIFNSWRHICQIDLSWPSFRSKTSYVFNFFQKLIWSCSEIPAHLKLK